MSCRLFLPDGNNKYIIASPTAHCVLSEIFLCLPEMGSNLAVKVRCTLGSRKGAEDLPERILDRNNLNQAYLKVKATPHKDRLKV